MLALQTVLLKQLERVVLTLEHSLKDGPEQLSQLDAAPWPRPSVRHAAFVPGEKRVPPLVNAAHIPFQGFTVHQDERAAVAASRLFFVCRTGKHFGAWS